uniref:Ig-like domain-containing protein n=1 Tax=Oryzias latipes TaxID=8090 RepID=A0A3B3IGR8_ORYLA
HGRRRSSRRRKRLLLVSLSSSSIEVASFSRQLRFRRNSTEGAPPTITSISWKFGPDLAADWDGATVDYYRHFEGRTQLNTSTGAMVLRSLNRTDTGKYTPEINNRILDPVQLSVIAAVPVPSITASCNEERTLCKMTCEADTAGAEPATFVWKADGREKNESSVKEFLCELRNPVSQESSSSPNPFSSSPTEAPGKSAPVSEASDASRLSKTRWSSRRCREPEYPHRSDGLRGSAGSGAAAGGPPQAENR